MSTEIIAFDIERQRFELDQRQAKAYSTSLMIPQHLRDLGSMMILNQMSRDFNLPMLTLAQQIYMVKGKVGMSGQLVISLINKSESVEHGMRWEIENEGTPQWRVRAWNTVDGEKLFGEWLSDRDVTMFGWKSNPLWKSMPIRMAKYRTATYWGRDYAPDVLMGLSDKDEIIDVSIAEPQIETGGSTLNDAVSHPHGSETVTEVDLLEDVEVAQATDQRTSQEIAFDQLKQDADDYGVSYRKDITYPSLFKKVEDHKLSLDVADAGEVPDTDVGEIPHDTQTGEVIPEMEIPI